MDAQWDATNDFDRAAMEMARDGSFTTNEARSKTLEEPPRTLRRGSSLLTTGGGESRA